VLVKNKPGEIGQGGAGSAHEILVNGTGGSIRAGREIQRLVGGERVCDCAVRVRNFPGLWIETSGVGPEFPPCWPAGGIAGRGNGQSQSADADCRSTRVCHSQKAGESRKQLVLCGHRGPRPKRTGRTGC